MLKGLRRRGLAERSAPGARIAGPLRLLARPDYQVDLRLQTGGQGPLVAIGAAAARYGVMVTKRDEQLSLRPVRPAWLVAELIALIGPITPGMGRAVNLPADVFDSAWEATPDGALWTLTDHLIELGIPRLDASSCVRMCLGIRTLGQIGTVSWANGAPRLGPWVIGFHSTDAGYFLQLRKPGPSGGTVTLCPLDPSRLARLADELLAANPDRHPRTTRQW